MPPVPENGCPKILEIGNPWGKVVSEMNIFVGKWSKIAAFFFVFFFADFLYKTWWKPRFPMDKRPLVKWYIANFGISLDVLSFSVLDYFFRLFFHFFLRCLCILCPPYCGIGATIGIGREIRCLPYAGFFALVNFSMLSGQSNNNIDIHVQ